MCWTKSGRFPKLELVEKRMSIVDAASLNFHLPPPPILVHLLFHISSHFLSTLRRNIPRFYWQHFWQRHPLGCCIETLVSRRLILRCRLLHYRWSLAHPEINSDIIFLCWPSWTINYLNSDLVVPVVSSDPCPRTTSEEWFKTNEVAQVDEEQRQHPDDQAHHHLDGQHRPGLRLTETTWAEPFSYFRVKFQQGNHHMFTVTICGFHTGVNINLSLFVGGLNVEPVSIWALASTPRIQQWLASSDISTNLLSTWSAPDEMPTVKTSSRNESKVVTDQDEVGAIFMKLP